MYHTALLDPLISLDLVITRWLTQIKKGREFNITIAKARYLSNTSIKWYSRAYLARKELKDIGETSSIFVGGIEL